MWFMDYSHHTYDTVLIGYLLNIFPDRPKQIFSLSDCQEVSFGFVELVCVILESPSKKKNFRINGVNTNYKY